jgi:uncharacterized membrane protein
MSGQSSWWWVAKRWLRHASTTPLALQRVLPGPVLANVEQAVARAERGHSGEIRLAVEASLPWSYLRRNAPARERARMLFGKLGVWDTEHNNGVLIYIELADRRIEIVADRGIARHVPQAEWDALCAALRSRFLRREFEAGLIECIEGVGMHLRRHFPLAQSSDNPDELSNRPALL